MSGTKAFAFAGERLVALPSGALWWPAAGVLTVSDLHLGKSERIARRSGMLLPPYEVEDTLRTLEQDMEAVQPRAVISLGDSFDDMEAAVRLHPDHRAWIMRLVESVDWTWVTGNHDPAPVAYGGTPADGVECGPLSFVHIATDAGRHEVSGHYHPKASLRVRGRAISRPAFLHDGNRLILPAYGTFTGGLRSRDPALSKLMAPGARAILAGSPMVEIPMPR
ncbi:ligase-associated DNA damage response endonuclease PdeM [Jannaschia sp. Os4]|uniref:ligase-associated DNA damage response endonuclease PdeM n=1 Tax=Jannaschia sp. Os4 TaxID=2807617 RepID=UPI00193A3CA7|nr:ligase-associated DNA damage response endonuclease PdeM [Jannaschia sp. Os4]MBM2574857.1 ligase-associated DNA damage response endonuclease PdeM [Jannaschia sp. Os4]